ncbi:multicopper oxidase family protein [Sinomonas sp. ASV486]|uniref:multicopper oxidase family protein n=1 Tax=Sinomonas sp. ASV486 TaxID=3051170 RepID=UPI0027DE4901|nr:multicopper oxidase family protein [Sinomonas sp. ASV486]MDQ4490882.1 multicopper oxidase family protein [Sinomonas sp. ASV486]
MPASAVLGVDLLLAAACAAAWGTALAAGLALTRTTAPGWVPRWAPDAVGTLGVLIGAGRLAVLFGGPSALVGDRLLGATALTAPGCLAGLAALVLPRLTGPERHGRQLSALAAASSLTTAGLLAVLTLGTPAGWLPVAVLGALALLATGAVAAGLAKGWRHRAVPALGTLSVAILVGSLAVAWMDSRGGAPSSFHEMDGHSGMSSTGPAASSPHANRSVDALRGSQTSGPVREFTLHARSGKVTLDNGSTVDALTFGSLPGPELRAVQGETVRVTLVNDSVADGVTLHWHGYDVPNAMDGVPGVTQDAVMPGQSFTYEFAAAQTGTYWYHTHQNGSADVPLGLYGALVVDPPGGPAPGVKDLTVPVHSIAGATLFGSHAGAWSETVAPGTPVRVRLINTDQLTQRFGVAGSGFRLSAVDGGDLAGGAELAGTVLPLAAGGRYDVVLTMPDHPVWITAEGSHGGALALIPPGDPAPSSAPRFGGGTELDLAAYGAPAASPVPHADATATYTADHLLRFVDGTPKFAFTINGAVYPNIPPLVVHDGENVLVTIVNRSDDIHPMHPHGHHVRVVSIDGRAVAADLRMDSLEVRPGQVWTVLLTADNPGIWMDHCHNLSHARDGMVFHLAYEGVGTPFSHDASSANRPE